jgi:Gas vesicle synthesis protein GvpO
MMAESKSSSGKSSSKSSSGKSSRGSSSRAKGSSSGNRSNQEPPLREIALEAAEQVQELIGRPVEAVTGVEKDGREWNVTLEVLELQRVPTTTDVMGRYEVTLDRNGEVTSARRTRRYPRAEAGED